MKKLNQKTREALEKIKDEINAEYGFQGTIPRINHGPCGVFSQIFIKKWNELFEDKVHICFILTKTKDDCDHILIRLPFGELYDGGVGIHPESEYTTEFLIEEMLEYDEALLEKWSYGLDRTYPKFCPDFDRNFVEQTIQQNLQQLVQPLN